MIKDQVLVKNMLDMINTLLEASQYLYNTAKNRNYNNFISVSNDMNDVINSIYNTIIRIKKEESIIINVDLACENARYSLQRIVKLSKTRSKKTLDKIEFELIPILEDMYLQLYFWGSVYPDKECIEKYYKNDISKLYFNKYINLAEENGEYKYDLSIIVLGYNKLNYTKLCIDNLVKYIPQNVNYELILVNHGSTDDTKEYFESIEPTKQLDLFKNGGSPTVIERVVEGKYFSLVSNDVIVTENAITNMIKCMESDEDIAWVVPTTPNMCNNQTIPANYNSIDEMHEFAKYNNISNPYRWEQKPRLCNPIDLKRSKHWVSSKGSNAGGYFHTPNMMIAPDEKVSLILRRKGYKMMLAKDAYCYHFGAITREDEIKNHKDKHGNVGPQAFYSEARQDFFNAFGIDPLGLGTEYDIDLFKCLSCDNKEHVDILGINCGIGSNPLRIKESIKENAFNLDVTIYNVTDEKWYIEDLNGVSDQVEYISNINDIENVFGHMKFNYIVFECKSGKYRNVIDMIEKLKSLLSEGGIIAVAVDDLNLKNKIKNISNDFVESGHWIVLK